MAEDLFRKDALDSFAGQDELNKALVLTAPLSWLALTLLGLGMAVAIVWSSITSVPITVKGQGILLNEGGLVDVVVATEGRLLRTTAKPGDQIKKGDPIAYIDQSELALQLTSAQADLKSANEHKDRVTNFHLRESSAEMAYSVEKKKALQQSLVNLKSRIRSIAERNKGYRELLQKGYIAKSRVLDGEVEMGKAQEQVTNLTNELKSIALNNNVKKVKQERELLKVAERISKATEAVISLKKKMIHRNAVRSPYTGRVVEAKANVGDYVSPGVPLFTVLRSDSSGGTETLIGVLFVPPADGKKVRVGMLVKIAPSTVKKEEYGFLMGQVTSVAEVPSTTVGMLRTLRNDQLVQSLSGEGAPFEIRVALEKDSKTATGYKWSSSRGPEDMTINSGTPSEAEVTVRETPLISLVVPYLEGFFPSVVASQAR